MGRVAWLVALLLLLAATRVSAVNLVVTGSGKAVTIFSGNSTSRVFDVTSGNSLELHDLTVRDGVVSAAATPSDVGGAIRLLDAEGLIIDSCTLENNTLTSTLDGNGNTAVGGGAVGVVRTSTPYSPSTTPVTLIDVWFLDNQALSSDGLNDAYGGALFMRAEDGAITCNITSSQFLRSSVATSGGAIWIYSGVTMAVFNTTFLENTANTLAGSGNQGGGAIYMSQTGLVTIDQSTFDQNSAGQHGGSILMESNRTLIVTGTLFDRGTTVSGDGGAVWLTTLSTLTCESCTFLRGNSVSGGAIGASDTSTTATLTECTFSNNTATNDGGAVCLFSSASGFVTECAFEDNSAGSRGGGMSMFSSASVTLLRSAFHRNTALIGGGIHQNGGTLIFERGSISLNTATSVSTETAGGLQISSADATLTQLTVSSNVANGGPGGIGVDGGTAVVNITACTIVLNNCTSTDCGGGIKLDAGLSGSATVELHNSIVANNLCPVSNITTRSVDISKAGAGASLVSLGHNLVRDQNEVAGDLVGTDLAAGLDPLLGPLQNNGGLTKSHLPLLFASPALEAGDSTLNATLMGTDQRFTGFLRLFGSALDIGAVEVQGPLLCGTLFASSLTSPISVTTLIDEVDFSNNVTSLREAVLIANEVGGAFVINLPAGLHQLSIPGINEDLSCTGDLDLYSSNLTSLTFNGAGAGTTLIDGGLLDRIFDTPVGNGRLVFFNSLTVQNGLFVEPAPLVRHFGGAIRLIASTLTVDSCTFFNNTIEGDVSCIMDECSVYGGAIGADCRSGSCLIIVSNTLFLSNTALASGGGISGVRARGGAIAMPSVTASELIITNCTFQSNTAELDAGAVSVLYEANVTITSSLFLLNAVTVAADGGAICFGTSDEPGVVANPILRATVVDCTFQNNTVADDGGAIAAGQLRDDPGPGGSVLLDISDSLFEDNTAPNNGDRGGAIFLTRLASMTLLNCTFRTNEALLGTGGAIFAFRSDLLLVTSCTFESNQALGTDGGAIFIDRTLNPVSISSSTFALNSADRSGGAIYISEAPSVVLVNGTLFESNVAVSIGPDVEGGGAIATRDGAQLTVEGSTFLNNNASITLAFKGAGGILATGNGTVTIIRGSLFDNNIGFCSGGVLNAQVTENGVAVPPDMLIEDCVFTNNKGIDQPSDTNSLGGGFGSYFGATNLIVRTRFAGNTANFGGAIYVESNTTIVTLRRCEISDGVAAFGGGISMFNGGTVSLLLCTLSGNTATLGGGLLVDPTLSGNPFSVVVDQCTVTNNNATTDGGGFNLNNAAVFNISNTVVANNTSPGVVDIYSFNTASFVSGGYNLIGDPDMGPDGAFPTTTGDLTAMDPLFSPLAFNGGSTRTHQFLPTSPLENGANPAIVETTDQRFTGFPRVIFGLADIGALELQVICPNGTLDSCGICSTEDDITNTASVIVVTTTADVIDPTDSLISLREAVGISNQRPGDQEIQLAAGTYDISLVGDDDENCVGDFDVQ